MSKVSDWTDELPEGSRCEWQICPHEMPKDMRPQAEEVWRLPDGKLVLFRFFIEGSRKKDSDWYNRVEFALVFDQRTENP